MATKPAAEDQLAYVLRRIESMPTSQYAEVAAGSLVVERTLYHIRKPGSDPRYSTVNRIYNYLKANEVPKRAARTK
jgi:predicted transcriptional regulator